MPDQDRGTARKLVRGEIDADERTTRLLLPTRDQSAWMPFDRFAESMTTSLTRVERHPHQAEEVVMYLLEGEIRHVDNGGKSQALTAGSTAVLTAHDEVFHALETVQGHRARWLSIVVRLPWHTEPPATSLQIKGLSDTTEASDGTVHRPVVGPLARADASSGLEVLDLEFAKPGTAFFHIGSPRRAVVYVLGGSGSIDDHPVDPGSGILIESASGVALHGSAGYRVVIASAPGPAPTGNDAPEPVRRRVK